MSEVDQQPTSVATEERSTLLDRLLSAQCAGCNCLTKSPELWCHDGLCHYRLHAEAYSEISMLRIALAEWQQKGEGLSGEDMNVLRDYLR